MTWTRYVYTYTHTHTHTHIHTHTHTHTQLIKHLEELRVCAQKCVDDGAGPIAVEAKSQKVLCVVI
jgi:hypothetical protein